MRHWILTLFLTASYLPCTAQGSFVTLEPAPAVSQSGTLNLFSLDVQTADVPITFSTGEDYSGKKIISGYYRIAVKSPGTPWIITASIEGYSAQVLNGFMPKQENNLVSLRCAGTGDAVRLSSVPQVILRSNNNLTENVYYVDLIIDPPFDYLPGAHPQMVQFQLAQQ